MPGGITEGRGETPKIRVRTVSPKLEFPRREDVGRDRQQRRTHEDPARGPRNGLEFRRN
jgi:hypothetical protein